MSNTPNDPFYLFGRGGTKDSPFKVYNEPLSIFEGRVLLTEVPHNNNHVVVKDGSTVYGEVYDSGALTTDNVYFVDYDSGTVYFDNSHNGKQLTFSYTGQGYFNVPARRVYTQSDNGEPTQNLQDMIDNYNQLNGTDLYNLFDPQTGHKHSGAAGDAPPIDSQYITYDNGNGTITNVKDTLDNTWNNFLERGVNVLYPPIPLIAVKGDGSTDDSNAIQSILNYCRDNNLDIIFPSKTYKLSNSLTWYYMHHSIKSTGAVTFDFSSMTSGVAITVKGSPSSDGIIWQGMMTSFKQFNLIGNSNIDAINISEVSGGGTSSPNVNIEHLYINQFNNAITLQNENWTHVFRRIFFRNNTHALNIKTVNNAGENIRFESCIFSGGTDYAIIHTSGTVEVTFDGCSFDYNKGVIYTNNISYRGLFRFINCHFEDDGSITEFNISTNGSATYYIKLHQCDWYFTGTFPTYISKITGDKISLVVSGCIFPLYTVTQDRSLSELFKVISGNVYIKVENNDIECSLNNYYQTMSRYPSLYPLFNSDNLSNGVFLFNGGGTIATDVSMPTNSPSSLTYKISGALDAWSHVPYNGLSKVGVTGWINRSEGAFGVQVRYFNTDAVQLRVDTISLPGTLGSWVKFGSQLSPPKGTVKIRLQLISTGATGTCYINDWVVDIF